MRNKLFKSQEVIIVILAFIALLVRLPFRSRLLYHWDSVNFALSLEKFDVRLHQPHPPGYILYSMLGSLINQVIHDANSSLVWISLVSGVIGVVSVYYCARILFDEEAGFIAAVIVIFNPLHLFYSEVALSYSLEFAVVPIWIILCYFQLTKKNSATPFWFYSSILLGILAGIRQFDLVFLLPLWLICLTPLNWRQRILSILTLMVVILIWLVPMVYLSGGIIGYWGALFGETSGVMDESSVFSIKELALNFGRLAIYLFYGLLIAGIPLIIGLWFFVRDFRKYYFDRKVWIFGLWLMPALLFFIFIHIRQPGHIFIIFPAVIILAAYSIQAITQIFSHKNSSKTYFGRPISITYLVVFLILLINILFFGFAPASLLGSTQLPLQTPSRQSIQQRDLFLDQRFQFIRSHFSPNETIILAGGLNYRHPDYYLRDFQFTDLSYRMSQVPRILPERIKTIILFDDHVFPEYSFKDGFNTVTFPGAGGLRFQNLDGTKIVKITNDQILIGDK